MGTPIYVTLNYDQYKAFESQWAMGADPLESEHKTEDRRFYHKAIRFNLGDLKFEVVGPMVMTPPATVCPLCDQPSPSGEVHQECVNEEAARDAARSEREDKHR